MQEQQLTQFYDKLLHYLNTTYITNIRIQELYLDLKKHTRKLRFKSIKNIYDTLTEGKADQVIYQREKPLLMKNNSFNQKFTERTCWRLIQKLIHKVAYYLMNEKKLNCLAPSILKTLNFARNAPDKASHKAAFVQFFSEVLDTLIAQNNLLEQKIYDLLIERGYIYSVDQFYRMSRFQGPNKDFTYKKILQQDENDNEQENQEKTRKPDFFKISSSQSITKSKKRVMSIKKIVHNRNKSRFEFDISQDEFQQKLPELQQDIAEEQQSEIEIDSDSSSQSSQVLENLKNNKIVHNIHNQLEKVVDQIINHKDFNTLLASNQHSQIKNDQKLVSKEPTIKQVLKNLKIKNFKANQKLINIHEQNIHQIQASIKNSKQRERYQLKHRYKPKHRKNEQNRSSIATALSFRMKERVFHNSGIQQIKELMVKNLGNLKDKLNDQDTQYDQKNGIRKHKRLQTQNFEAHLEQNAMKMQRKSSNMNFLKNAFVFNSASKPGTNFLQLRSPHYTRMLNQSSISSQNLLCTAKTITSKRNNKKSTKDTKDTYKENKSSQRKSLFSNQKIVQVSRFRKNNRCGQIIEGKDIKEERNKQFNTNLLQLAAKKYHRCQTEQCSKLNFQELFRNFQTQITLRNRKTLADMQKRPQKQHKNPYMHHRKYQTFDRINRRFF